MRRRVDIADRANRPDDTTKSDWGEGGRKRRMDRGALRLGPRLVEDGGDGVTFCKLATRDW